MEANFGRKHELENVCKHDSSSCLLLMPMWSKLGRHSACFQRRKSKQTQLGSFHPARSNVAASTTTAAQTDEKRTMERGTSHNDAATTADLPILPRVPRHLLLQARYSAATAPSSCEAFLLRHRDLPCVFTGAAAYLFDEAQRCELGALFPRDWQSDPRSPLRKLLGCVRDSKAHRGQAADRERTREASVQTFLHHAAAARAVSSGEKHGRAASDLRLSTLSQAQSLCRGPALFRGYNMLEELPLESEMSTQDHIVCHLLLGTR